MKQTFLIACIFFVLLTTANTEDFFKCTDSNGDTVLSSFPQVGMKCVKGINDDVEEPKSPKISSKTNLVDKCADFFHELDDISAEITAQEKRRSELQREQLETRKNEAPNNKDYYRRWGNTTPENNKMNTLNREISVLYQKKSIINQDISLYKCYELNNDLSRLNQNRYDNNRDRRYRNR
jgi:hypothetical protein